MENPDFLTTTFEKADCLELSRGLIKSGVKYKGLIGEGRR